MLWICGAPRGYASVVRSALLTEAAGLLIDRTSTLSVQAQSELLTGTTLGDEAATVVEAVVNHRERQPGPSFTLAEREIVMAIRRPPDQSDPIMRAAVASGLKAHGPLPASRDLPTARRVALALTDLSRTEPIEIVGALRTLPAEAVPLRELLLARHATPAAPLDIAAVQTLAGRVSLVDRLLELAPLLVSQDIDEAELRRRRDQLLAFWAEVPGLRRVHGRRGHTISIGGDSDAIIVGRDVHIAPRAPMQAPERAGPPPSAGDEPPGPREAWPLLEAPEEVPAETEFDLRVGLSPAPVTGVGGTGRMLLPAEPFTMQIELDVDGFTVVGPARRPLPVTREEPYPTLTVTLSASADPDLKRVREIGCTFVLDGVLHGYASRLIEVVPPADTAHGIDHQPGPPTELGLDFTTPEEAADLTIVITRGDDKAETKLLWKLYSPHLSPPTDLDPVDIGDKPKDFAASIINTGSAAANNPQGIFDHLVGCGQRLAQHMPQEARQALAHVVAHLGDAVPAVLIATTDPYLPWEVAVLDRDLQYDHPDRSPFLGAQVAIGRWPLTGQEPPPRPLAKVTVKDRAVVSASYVEVQGVTQLEAAEAEAAELLGAWAGSEEIPPTLATVRQLLRGKPAADLLHFAIHGQFSETTRNGLVLIDTDEAGTRRAYYLQPEQVEAGRLDRRPFVFLNACQVAAGTTILGDHAGLAAALLTIGAASVVAPLWSIDDKVAHGLATDFYEKTLEASSEEALPVAEVLRRGRARFTPELIDANQAAGASTHLAFQFFGHPRLKLEAAT